jgi:hypothetical protein
LRHPPWGRWLLAAAIVIVGSWFELRPVPTTGHPFAVDTIPRGTTVDSTNTEMRAATKGLFDPIPDDVVALRDIAAGEPILRSAVGESAVPDDWWAVSLELPPAAASGDRVRLVILDTGQVVEGRVVTGPGLDPLQTGLGAVAMPGEEAPVVAAAAMEGRVAVMVSTG